MFAQKPARSATKERTELYSVRNQLKRIMSALVGSFAGASNVASVIRLYAIVRLIKSNDFIFDVSRTRDVLASPLSIVN